MNTSVGISRVFHESRLLAILRVFDTFLSAEDAFDGTLFARAFEEVFPGTRVWWTSPLFSQPAVPLAITNRDDRSYDLQHNHALVHTASYISHGEIDALAPHVAFSHPWIGERMETRHGVGYMFLDAISDGVLLEAGLSIHDLARVFHACVLAFSTRASLESSLSLARLQGQTDPLTGLGNRRSMLDAVHRYLLDRAPFSLLVFDMDGLKRINDTYGHSYGDAALQVGAGFLRLCFREHDILARWGGDEFVVALPGVIEVPRLERASGSWPLAALRASAVAEAVAVLETLPQEALPRFSVGASCFPHEASTMDALLAIADERMYAEKRNRKHA